MIDLNCSYEESKKILDLGYDFGKKFGDVYKKKDCPDKYILVEYHKMKAQEFSQVSEKYFDTDVEQFTLERQSIDYEDSLYNNKHIEYFEQGEMFCNPNKEGFVPIIPKAALEACLPDFLCVKDFYGELDRSRFVKRLCNGMIDLNSQDSMTVSHYWFKSAYKAFTWCHENYPEELKKKFNEVMA